MPSTPNPLERPSNPNQPQKPSPTQRPVQPAARRVIQTGGNRGSGNNPPPPGNRGNGRNNNNEPEPSPWLDPEHQPSPDSQGRASFVEYLRWMRPPNHDYYKDATKVQILQMAEEGARYGDRLKQLVSRTQRLAATSFQVKCPWRIRVGGTKGPESILLPAFDALGIPYIPSSTLRGVARTQAIREHIKNDMPEALENPENLKIAWKKADLVVSKWFGSQDRDANKTDQAGKVVFFDAYPLPNQHGLSVDMANNLWNWKENNIDYSPNPNPFFSLQEPVFLIGLKLASSNRQAEDKNTVDLLEQAKGFLIRGLQSAIGSQVNTGYGELLVAGKGQPTNDFLQVSFTLEGQLIHGRQKFISWTCNDRGKWQMRGQPDAEVRPVAFKSMLRYWFRALSWGVLPVETVKEWEAKLFGSINFNSKPTWGWVRVVVRDGKVIQREPRPNFQGKNDACGEQEGTLAISLTPSCPPDQASNTKDLLKALTWLIFHLGGIGQGARRPCYSRKTRDRAPWYRGSTFYIDSEEDLWELPDTVKEFQTKFQARLKNFYAVLKKISNSQLPINSASLKITGEPTQSQWFEAVDKNCQIIICSGKDNNSKPYALSVLHAAEFKKSSRSGQLDYDGDLCGQVFGNKPKPSPVWIADLGNYQVVTVFGATKNPRQLYLEKLKAGTSQANYAKIFPLS